MIAEIFESEGQQLALGHASDAKVEPSLIVLVFAHVGHGIASNPDVEEILLVASRGPRHITTAKLAAKHDLGLRDFPPGPLRVTIQHLLAVHRLEGGQRALLRTAAVAVSGRAPRGSTPVTLCVRLTVLF